MSWQARLNERFKEKHIKEPLLENQAVQGSKDASHVLDEELGQAVGIGQTFLQLSQEVAAVEESRGETL